MTRLTTALCKADEADMTEHEFIRNGLEYAVMALTREDALAKLDSHLAEPQDVCGEVPGLFEE